MNIWMHSTIAATALVATIAVAVAGVAMYGPAEPTVAPKADRLEIAQETRSRFVTVESQGDNMTILSRVPVTVTASN